MLLLVDENVPRSVATFLQDRGHDVRFVTHLLAAGAADPIVASAGDQLAAIVVTWDRHFDALVEKVPRGGKARFRRLGRISFRCKETQGRVQLERWIEYIKLHHRRTRQGSGDRMIAEIQGNALRLL